ncbi:MAG: hypothetical protein AB2551_06355 [Candidatus Thiodiazotropha sp.]
MAKHQPGQRMEIDTLLIPLFLEATTGPEGDTTLHFWSFVTLFAVSYLVMYLGYGYRITIESDLQQPDNRTLVVQSIGNSVATSIPMETIEQVVPVKYRDLPDDMYAIPQIQPFKISPHWPPF